MHVKGFADQTHMCTNTQTCITGFEWCFRTRSPPVSSPGFFMGRRSAGAVCVANRVKAEGHGQGTSLLKGSCNFHSRVLLKLVPRPGHPLDTSSSPTQSVPLHPNSPVAVQLQPDGSPYRSIHLPHLCDLCGRGWTLVRLCDPVGSDLPNQLYSTNKSLLVA